MKNLFIALMFALGLAVTPALASDACGGKNSFEEFAAAATEDYYVISGPSLDAFALSVEATNPGMAKPAEIIALAIPATAPTEGPYTMYTFIASGCPFGSGSGYLTIDSMVSALGAAATVNDKMVILKANPDAKPKPSGLGI